jgi:hypothetical protein
LRYFLHFLSITAVLGVVGLDLACAHIESVREGCGDFELES